ncbi:MAG: hypothetical protein HY747_12765, partial [Elusimicrobia bacterium]|nr:hypothetical protein [Elusimicrobiota bacterium]
MESTVDVGIDSRTITFDLNAPTTTVSNFVSTNPVIGPFYVNPDFTVISGTITDSPADISTMTVALSSSPTGAGATWWNGLAFTASFGDGVYFATSAWTEGNPDQWQWDPNNAVIPNALVHGTTYFMRIRSWDQSSPVKERIQNFTFFYDAVKPTATITFPSVGYSTNQAINITGSSTDDGLLTQAATVFVLIDKSGGGGTDCFNRSANNFTADCDVPSAAWFPATGTVNSWQVGGVNWALGGVARYFITARASDTANNVQVYFSTFGAVVSSVSFTYDSVAPASYITSISSGSFYRQAGQLAGTAADNNLVSDISLVEIEVRNFGNDNQEGGEQDTYWDGDGFDVTASSWVAVNYSGGVSGTWDYPIWGWTSGRKYRLSVRAKDAAGNQEADEAGPIFTMDFSSPTAAFSQPAKDSGWKYFPAIQGTANDGTGDTVDPYQAGIRYSTHVQVAIQRQDTLQCWDGSWFAAGCHPRWVNAVFTGSSSGTWSYTGVPTGANAPSGVRYLVLGRSGDAALPGSGDAALPQAGNIQSVFNVGVSSAIFYIDNSSGSAALTFPYNTTQRNNLAIASGTISDEFSGVYQAVLRISTGTSYWNGSSWLASSTEIFVLAAASGTLSSTWSYVNLPSNWGASGQVAAIDVRGRDVAGNVQNDVALSSAQWLYDTQPPTALVTTPANDGLFYSPAFALNNILGTATEVPTHAYAKVSEAQLRIKESQNSTCWTGSSWTTTSNDCEAAWISSSGWNSGSVNWSFPKPTSCGGDWCDNIRYDLHIRAKDQTSPNANLGQQTTRYFTYDSALPTTAMTEPDTAFEDAGTFPGNITGTASDGENARRSKVYSVEVAIRNPKGGPDGWWNGSNFTSVTDDNCLDDTTGGCWIKASTGPEGGSPLKINWTFTSTPTWTSGQSYRVKVRVKDNAGNTATIITRDFTYDTSGIPGVGISLPVDGGKYKAGIISNISGTASDQFMVVSASIAVREQASQLCWSSTATAFTIQSVADDGGGVEGCPSQYWLTATLAGEAPNYNWTRPMVSLQDHYKYEVKARAIDQESKKNQTGFILFTYDITKPTSSVKLPANGAYLSSLTQITGTAEDYAPNESGISAGGGVQAAIKGSDPNNPGSNDYWWKPEGGWTVASHAAPPNEADWLSTSWSGTEWTKNTGLPGASNLAAGNYTLYSRAYDVAKNTQTSLADSVYFVWDTTGPLVSISTPTTASVKVYSSLLEIGGTGNDANNVKAVYYRLKSPDQYWYKSGGVDYFNGTASQWHLAKGSSAAGGLMNWTTGYLPDFDDSTYEMGNQNWILEAKAVDEAGVYSSVYSTATFKFDITAPVTITTNAVEGSTLTAYAVLAGTGADTNGLIDPGSVNDALQLRIKDGDTGQYWSKIAGNWTGGGFFALDPANIQTFASSYTWFYTHAKFQDGTAWTSGNRYQIALKARDPVSPSNYENNYTTRTFAFDKLPPVSDVSNPGPLGTNWDGSRDYKKDIVTDPFPISGTASDATAGLNDHDAIDGEPWAVRVNICEDPDTTAGCPKWYNLADSSFTADVEPASGAWTANTSWVFNIVSPSAKLKNGYYYRTKVIGQDKVGNIENQGSKSMREFLIDTTYPTATLNNPDAADELDTIAIRVTVNDPEPTPDPWGGGSNASGIIQPGKIELSVRLDNTPTSINAGNEDYWWCVNQSPYCVSQSTWVLHGSSDPPVSQLWYTLVEPTATIVSGSTWDDNQLKCDNDTERIAGSCWRRGKTHQIQTRVTDRAGNTTTQATPTQVLIVSDADHFLVTLNDSPPYTAGTAHQVNVYAHDNLHNIVANYNGTVRFQMLDTTPPETIGGGENGLPADTTLTSGQAVNIPGLKLRRAGTSPLSINSDPRSINVYQMLPSEQTGINSNILHPLSITVTTAPANRLLILDAEKQEIRAGCVTTAGNCSTTDGLGRWTNVSIATKTAGTSFQVKVMATDQYYNKVTVSSEPVFSIKTPDDLYDTTESDYADRTLTGGEQTYNITLKSKGNRTVTAAGAGDESGNWNDLVNLPVQARTQSSPKKLLVLLPNESSEPGSSTGKTGNPITGTIAGNITTVTVHAADQYFNPYSYETISEQPAVYLVTSDPYDAETATITLNSGTTQFYLTMYQASTQTVWARTATSDFTNYEEGLAPGTTNITINPATPVKLQLLMPGEEVKAGYSGGVAYSVSRTTGGKSAAMPDVLTAGNTVYATVRCVDMYFNKVNSCNPTV